MKKRKILVVGGLAAGPSAAAKAVRTNPNVDVTLFETSETVSYGICESPFLIGGVIDNEEKLMIYTPQQLQKEKSFFVKTLHHVEKIDPHEHKITVQDMQNRTLVDYEYDKLILATGATPHYLGIAGEDGRNVFHLRSREDVRCILNYLKSESPKNVVIIGGGYIGMEMTEALHARGLEVSVLHQYNLPLETLEQETREKVLEELKQNNIQFVPDVTMEAFQQDKFGKVRNVITNKGTFEADMVIVAVGIKPNVTLAKEANIRIGQSGAILTDERQQTSIDDIYAAGDCCEIKNIVTGKPIHLPLATVATKTGWVAGQNAAGSRVVMKGAIRAAALKVFNLEVAHVGISSNEARENGFSIITETITSPSKVSIMPGGTPITIKLIVDSRTLRLLGANVYGIHSVVHRANILAVAIKHKLSIDDISHLDLIYAPPFTPLWDPVLIVANRTRKKSTNH